jgi:hypothetical protein
VVGVEATLDCERGEVQCLPPHGRFESPEIKASDGLWTYEALDFGGDRRLDLGSEPLFSLPAEASLSPPPNSASAHCSHTSHRASMSARKAWPAAIWWRTISACSGVKNRECVRPAILRVQLK